MHSPPSVANGVLRPDDPSPETQALLRAWLAVQRCFGLYPQRVCEQLRRDPDPRRLLRGAGGLPSEAELDRAVRALRSTRTLAVPIGSSAYPARLERLIDAPPLLLLRGDVRVPSRPCVAIVGARAATVYGLDAAKRFASELASAGVVIVSGLAVGIDAAAHRAALEVGGTTLAVQACGPDRVYPARHRRLADDIAKAGGVLTEFFPGTRPRPAFFPLRNRLISALSVAVLVVEARERSGSLLTAGHAANQGVDVFAVPGPISAPTSRGSNRLLRDGAGVALEPGDILNALGLAGVAPKRAASVEEWSDEQHRILRTLERESQSRDELAHQLGRTPEQLALGLAELELSGRVSQDRDGRLCVVSPPEVREL